jgi:hypothetical protein
MSIITESERVGNLPPRVGEAAAAFYGSLHEWAAEQDLYLDAHEVEMVRQLVLAKDRLDVLDDMRAEVDAIAAEYTDGESRLTAMNTRLTIMREQRQLAATFGRQVGQLRLPVGLADAAGNRESLTAQRARAASRARWGERNAAAGGR